MTLNELNAPITLLEWWAQDVAKNMKKKGTVGAFTQQCQDMGFQKSSYNCIKYVKTEYAKAKVAYEKGEVSKKEYDEWALKNKRATLAKTFKGWAKKKKDKNKEK
jgi:hypothetical protein